MKILCKKNKKEIKMDVIQDKKDNKKHLKIDNKKYTNF